MSESFSPRTDYELIHGDCLKLLPTMEPETVDVVWTDPPYFLSNGGQTCKNGKRAKVNKGQWDESKGLEQDHLFHHDWLSGCQRVLKSHGTLWVTATHHTLFSIGFAMKELGFKILNLITWQKPNPPPESGVQVFYAFDRATDMGGEELGVEASVQLRGLKAPSKAEKSHGSHPTQKPLALIERCLLASTSSGDVILDPFMGSGTTGVAAVSLGRRFIGIESDLEHYRLAQERMKAAIEHSQVTGAI